MKITQYLAWTILLLLFLLRTFCCIGVQFTLPSALAVSGNVKIASKALPFSDRFQNISLIADYTAEDSEEELEEDTTESLSIFLDGPLPGKLTDNYIFLAQLPTSFLTYPSGQLFVDLFIKPTKQFLLLGNLRL